MRSPKSFRFPAVLDQFGKFALVGISGYLVNLAAFSAARGGGMPALAAATLSFCVAVVNNYVWNRLWTFRGDRGSPLGQGIRFLVVSLLSLGCNLVVLWALVRAGIGALPAQAIGIAASLPVNFAGNKLWTFSPRRAEAGGPPRWIRARRLALTGAVAFAILASLAGAGWAVQITVLKPPSPAARLAVNTSTLLRSRRLAIDVFAMGHRRVRGACLNWSTGRPGHKRLHLLLDLRSGQRILSSNRHKMSLRPRGARTPVPARVAMQLGCTSSLANALERAAPTNHLWLQARRFSGRPVVALVINRRQGDRLVLLLSRHRHVPIAALAVNRARSVTARFYLPRPSPALLKRLDLRVPRARR